MTREDSETSKLRIAIVGSGLVGTFATVALSRLPNVEVTTFERSPVAREAGALISLTESGLNVLTQFFDIDEIHAVSQSTSLDNRFELRDWKTDEVVTKQISLTAKDKRYAVSKTQRSAILNLLLSKVPEGTIRYGHKVEDIVFNDENNTVLLKFEGIQEQKEFDLVVAADGIYSKIRTTIYPETVPVPKGTVAYRSVFSEDLLKDIESYKNKEGHTLAYTNSAGFVFFSKIGLGQYGLVFSTRESPEIIEKLKWDRKVDDDDLKRVKEHFKEWPQIIRDLLDATPYLNAFPLDSAPWLEHLSYRNRLAFVGDAAHPTAGAFGAGASFGYGDVWALYRGLQATSSNAAKRKRAVFNDREYSGKDDDVYDLTNALFLFDETRRHFLKDVYEEIGRDKKSRAFIQQGSDVDEFTERALLVTNEFSWLSEHNVELEFQRVRAKNIHLLYK